MSWKALSTVFTRFLFISALVLLSAASSTAQTAEKPALEAQEYEFVLDTLPLPELVVPDDSATGWLILNGELISPPYRIVVENGVVKVNGIDVRGERKPRKKEIDPNKLAAAEAGRELVGKFRKWRAELGLEEARKRSLEFMQQHPRVEKAYMRSETGMAIKYYGLKHEIGFPMGPARATYPYAHAKPRHNLNVLARSFRGYLSRGCLIIQQGLGAQACYNLPKAERILKQIREAVETNPNMEARFEAVKKIVGFKSMSRSIAERFKWIERRNK